MVIGRVVGLARFPVKSMGGESLERVQVTSRGLLSDRFWGVYTADGGIGSGKTTRRFRHIDGLLAIRSRLDDERLSIEFPDRSVLAAQDSSIDQRLSDVLGEVVSLRVESDVGHHDESPVHLVTTASLRRLSQLVGKPVDARRVRANILLDVDGTDFVEGAWEGQRLAIGDDVLLRLGAGMPRCAMVNATQPGIAHDARVLKALSGSNGLELGLQADVLHVGTLQIGDLAELS